MLIKHAFGNAVISLVPVIGRAVAVLISGAFITETLFQLPGVGNLTVAAVLRRDYPLIQGALLPFSTIALIVNLPVDVAYGYLNPAVMDARRRAGDESSAHLGLLCRPSAPRP